MHIQMYTYTCARLFNLSNGLKLFLVIHVYLYIYIYIYKYIHTYPYHIPWIFPSATQRQVEDLQEDQRGQPLARHGFGFGFGRDGSCDRTLPRLLFGSL